MRKHYSWLYGINGISILNKFKYYHVIEGLAPDIMHDILEGVLPLTTSLFISRCIENTKFTLVELNHIIKNFNYGPCEVRDKPSKISRKHTNDSSIRGSATQTWLLSVNLLLMMGAKCDEDEPALHCFTLHLNVCRVILKHPSVGPIFSTLKNLS